MKREITLTLRVNEEEYALLQEKMISAGTTNFSLYARKMLVDGMIIRHDYSGIKELARELGFLARNIHQIVKRANETRNIYEQDLRDIQNEYAEVKSKVSERLVKILRSE